jgi:hypothetical protein
MARKCMRYIGRTATFCFAISITILCASWLEVRSRAILSPLRPRVFRGTSVTFLWFASPAFVVNWCGY